MGLLESLVLGIVQGITEFLPVSSSGHLVLLPAVLGWTPAPLVFDTTVHLATLLALLAVFWRDFVGLVVAWWRGLRHGRPLETPEARLAWWVILGTIPGALAGFLLEDYFAGLFGSPRAAGGFLLLTALVLVLAEWLGRRRRSLTGMGWLDALVIGIGQAAAIAPGLSRSGTTISAAMYRGLTRPEATRFSFILSAPIIAGAGLSQLLKLGGGAMPVGTAQLLVGSLAAAVFGYLAIRLLLNYVRRHPFYPFAIYCAVVGILAIAFLHG
jgi:undecaprenyl-diphosphatase